jgi:hypothetical protein
MFKIEADSEMIGISAEEGISVVSEVVVPGDSVVTSPS